MKTLVGKFASATAALALSLNLSLLNVLAGPAVTSISCGSAHSLFSKFDGSLWGMGDNSYGQLGLGFSLSNTNANVPAQILSSGVQRVTAGANHSLFLAGGSLWVMGYNQYGQLGDGTTNNQYVPEKIFTGTHNLSVHVMAGGYYHSLYGTDSPIVVPNNALYAMGANGAGELGDGTFTVHYSPEQLRSSTIISAVTAGEGHSLYLQSNGSLWGMGDNSAGQLGLGSVAGTNIQVQLTSSGVTAVAAGTYHSLFIESDGSLWVMGDNAYGQLGDNTTTDQRTPEKIFLFGVTAVAAGNNHSLFIGSNGSLWGMGLNSRGQLGLGVTISTRVPALIVSSNVIAVAAAGDHSLFIKSDGSLWGMGYNSSGELGVGDYTTRTVPVRIVGGLPPPPVITGISFSGPNLMLTGTNGLNGEILYTLTSTDLTQPLSQWQSVATNVLSANGSFTITAINAVTPEEPQQFYILQAQ
jgi:alpha-tubulin suppressor-like RCC1 family protein